MGYSEQSSGSRNAAVGRLKSALDQLTLIAQHLFFERDCRSGRVRSLGSKRRSIFCGDDRASTFRETVLNCRMLRMRQRRLCALVVVSQLSRRDSGRQFFNDSQRGDAAGCRIAGLLGYRNSLDKCRQGIVMATQPSERDRVGGDSS